MTKSQQPNEIRVATYNIHSWQGMDGKRDPNRILEAIDQVGADMLAVQEVTSPCKAGEPCTLTGLAGNHGYHVTFGHTMLRQDSHYGNALLSRREPTRVLRHDLCYPEREPRGALEVWFSYGGVKIKTVATHLGLHPKERAYQMDMLFPRLAARDADVVIFLGDFNDWYAWSSVRRRIRGIFGPQPQPRSFPSIFPVLALDKIHVKPGSRLKDVSPIRTDKTKRASDHLPLVATVDISKNGSSTES